MPLTWSFPAFVVIGGVGFLIDAGVLSLLVATAGMSPLWARAVSFPAALTVTWWLNRRYAFRGRGMNSAFAEYAAYGLIQTLGAVLNVGVFVACLRAWPGLSTVPVVPLAAGAGVALGFNFITLRAMVYRRLKHREDPLDG